MVAAAVIGGGATLLGAGVQAYAGHQAANAQEDASNQANATQLQMYNQSRADAEPWRQAGQTGLNALMGISGLDPNQSPNQLLEADPGYQFRQTQQQQGLERSAAARGGLMSGRAMKDTLKYSGDLASQEYGNVWNRLANIAGIGQATNQQNAALGQGYANAYGNNITSAANARASGYVNTANAVNQGIGGLTNYYAQSQLINQLKG